MPGTQIKCIKTLAVLQVFQCCYMSLCHIFDVKIVPCSCPIHSVIIFSKNLQVWTLPKSYLPQTRDEHAWGQCMGHFAEQTTVVCSGWIEITQRTAIPVPSVFNFALQDLLLFQPQDFQPKTAEKKSCIFSIHVSQYRLGDTSWSAA